MAMEEKNPASPHVEVRTTAPGSAAAAHIDTLNQYITTTGSPPSPQWKKPSAPILHRNFVGRQTLVADLCRRLRAASQAEMTAQPRGVGLYGTGGIGKSFLALKLAQDLKTDFAGGIIHIPLGPDVLDETGAKPLLSLLARPAFGGVLPPQYQQLEPDMVRGWLESAPGRVLVIFDDAWKLEPLQFLAAALSANVVRLVTSRFAEVAGALGGYTKQLDRLDPDDALALLQDRLDWSPNPTQTQSLGDLAALLDFHPLALDIVAARLKSAGRLPGTLQTLRANLSLGNLDDLQLAHGDDRNSRVRLSLELSYRELSAHRQQQFRALGIFAPGTIITADAAAAIWGLEGAAAEPLLQELADLALLVEESNQADLLSYRQHAILRYYAFGLAGAAGEQARLAQTHATFFLRVAWAASTAQPRNYAQLDLYQPNLLAAIEWAETSSPALCASLMEPISEFWLLRGQVALLQKYLPLAVEAARVAGNTLLQANTLRSLGDLERQLGNLDDARRHYAAALPLYELEQDRLGRANTLQSLGDLRDVV